MEKRTVMIGAIVFAISLLVWILSPTLAPLPLEYSNFTINPNSFRAANFSIPAGQSVLLVDANFSGPVNVYGFTKGAFARWASTAGTGLQKAEAFEGSGLLAAYTNVSEFIVNGTIPGVGIGSNGAVAGHSIYSAKVNSSSGVNYTIVFENSYGPSKPVRARMAYIEPLSASQLGNGSKVSNYIIELGAIGWAFLALLLAGIGLMVYGVIRKPRVDAVKVGEEVKERDRIYRSAGKGTRR